MIETWHLQVLLILIMQVLSSHVLFVFIVVVLFVFVSLLFAVNADFEHSQPSTPDGPYPEP